MNRRMFIISSTKRKSSTNWDADLVSLKVIRFGHDWDPTCMKMDEVLYGIAEKVKNYAVVSR